MPSLNEVFTDFDNDDWTSPVNMLKIKAAVSNQEPTVVLGSRTYAIKYNESDRVFIKSISGYAPCGWFSKQRLERYEPEGDKDK